MQPSEIGTQINIDNVLRGHIEKHGTAVVTKYFYNPIAANGTVPREGKCFKANNFVCFGKGIFVQIHTLPEDPHTASNIAAVNIAKYLRWFRRHPRNHQRDRDEKLWQLQKPVITYHK